VLVVRIGVGGHDQAEPVTSLRRSSSFKIAWMWTTEGVTAFGDRTMRFSRSADGADAAHANVTRGRAAQPSVGQASRQT